MEHFKLNFRCFLGEQNSQALNGFQTNRAAYIKGYKFGNILNRSQSVIKNKFN
jgi:hypothetical protein